MKAKISIPGEPGVGITPITIEVETGLVDFNEPRTRKFVRDKLSECYSSIHDDDADVWFEDECPDCMQVIGNNKCMNNDCITGHGYTKEGQDGAENS